MPKDYAEAKLRLRGRDCVTLPDGRWVMDYGHLTSLNKSGRTIIVLENGARKITYWEDGTVDYA